MSLDKLSPSALKAAMTGGTEAWDAQSGGEWCCAGARMRACDAEIRKTIRDATCP